MQRHGVAASDSALLPKPQGKGQLKSLKKTLFNPKITNLVTKRYVVSSRLRLLLPPPPALPLPQPH